MTQHDQTRAFLAHLHRGGQYAYWWTSEGRQSSWWQVNKPTPRPGGRHNVYFGIHPTDQIPPANRRGEPREPAYVRSQIAYIAAVNCLFAEFDAKDFSNDLAATLAHVEAIEPAASVIIASGGGYHCYWLLDQPWLLPDEAARQEAARVQEAWVDRTGGDTGAKDLARVLRVPGSRNWKYDPARVVEYVRCDLTRTYALSDLQALLPERHDSETPRPITGPAPADRADEWAKRKLADAIRMVATATNGTRHSTLLKAARLLGGVTPHISQDEIVRALTAAAPGGWEDDREVERVILDGVAYGQSAPLTPPVTPPALVWNVNTAYCPRCGEAARASKFHDGDLYCPCERPALTWRGAETMPPRPATPPAPARETTEYRSAPPMPTTAPRLATKKLEPTRYYILDMLRAGLALLIGNPGIGKTPALMQLAIAFALGGMWLGSVRCRKTKVLYIGVEYDEAYIQEVLIDSAGTTDLPEDLLILSVETFTPPATEEESIAMLSYYLDVLKVEVIIIDVFSGFLPREKFKQNAYRGDYAEFLAYHRMCLSHKALLVGAWHGTKRDKDPEMAYNGGQGMWGSAGGGRLTMFYDDDQQVRLRSQLRGHQRKEWVIEEARANGAHFWSTVDADPDPIFGSDAQRRIYHTIKKYATLAEPLTPAGVRGILKSDHPDIEVKDTYIRQFLGRLEERGLLAKVGGGYVLKRDAQLKVVGSRGSAVTGGSRGSAVTGGSQGDAQDLDSDDAQEAIQGGSLFEGGWIAPEGGQDAENGGAIQAIHDFCDPSNDPRCDTLRAARYRWLDAPGGWYGYTPGRDVIGPMATEGEVLAWLWAYYQGGA